MTRSECVAQYKLLGQRMNRTLGPLLPFALVGTLFFLFWIFRTSANLRHQQAELRRQPRTAESAQQWAALRRHALIAMGEGLGVWFLLIGGATWRGQRVLAANAPRCDQCGCLLNAKVRHNVLSTGRCPFCHGLAFTEDSSPDSAFPNALVPVWRPRFLPFTSFSDRLCKKYQRWILSVVMGTTFAVVIPLLLLSALGLSHALHIPINVPVIDQPNGIWWIVLFLTGFVVSLVFGYLVGFALLAALLRYIRGWSSERVRALIFESQIPAHWLKNPAEAKDAV